MYIISPIKLIFPMNFLKIAVIKLIFPINF